MRRSPDNEYHDPSSLGSLSGALRLWQTVRAAREETSPRHVTFTFSCPTESRADRVAGYLRRRRACVTTRVSQSESTGPEAWQVEGLTHHQIQSLPNLEHLSTWLRTAASSYRVDLVSLTLEPTRI